MEYHLYLSLMPETLVVSMLPADEFVGSGLYETYPRLFDKFGKDVAFTIVQRLAICNDRDEYDLGELFNMELDP